MKVLCNIDQDMTDSFMLHWQQYDWKFYVTLTLIWLKVLCNIDHKMTESFM